MKRIVVGISGSTSVIYGIRLIQTLKEQTDIEIHLVMSKWAEENIRIETNYLPEDIRAMANRAYLPNEMDASIASGSFQVEGMIILPCSMKTLSAVANGYSNNLITRAADVMIKEKRLLVMSPRETPLSSIHLENMLRLSRLGVCIIPPIPSFYSHPKSIDDLIRHHIMKILDQFKISVYESCRWKGNL